MKLMKFFAWFCIIASVLIFFQLMMTLFTAAGAGLAVILLAGIVLAVLGTRMIKN